MLTDEWTHLWCNLITALYLKLHALKFHSDLGLVPFGFLLTLFAV